MGSRGPAAHDLARRTDQRVRIQRRRLRGPRAASCLSEPIAATGAAAARRHAVRHLRARCRERQRLSLRRVAVHAARMRRDDCAPAMLAREKGRPDRPRRNGKPPGGWGERTLQCRGARAAGKSALSTGRHRSRGPLWLRRWGEGWAGVPVDMTSFVPSATTRLQARSGFPRRSTAPARHEEPFGTPTAPAACGPLRTMGVRNAGVFRPSSKSQKRHHGPGARNNLVGRQRS